MSLDKDKYAILSIFNLESENVQDIDFYNDPTGAVICVLLRPDYPPCPDCGCPEVTIKGYEHKRINHGLLSDRKCTILYHARRYKCPVCKRTLLYFYQLYIITCNS